MNKTVELWLEKVSDAELKEELYSLLSDEKELENRFYKDLSFGTGGLRGILGVGSNCMNIYTVARASDGVALYMTGHGMRSAAVSYDSRIHSKLFAETAARVFARRGIHVVIVRELMPTPFLSYMTRECGCDIGVMITASHNPAKYNGYKVYNAEGCQITDSAAKDISDCIGEIRYFETEADSFDSFVRSGQIEYAGDELEERYLRQIRKRSGCSIENLSVTYTALNGTGWCIVPKLLRSCGIGGLYTVDEQVVPDGNFPTCKYPNPEKAEALELGLTYARRNGSDLLLATDPDADRVGIAVRDGGEYKLLTGNEVGVLLCEYLLSGRKAKGTLPAHPVIIKTIVTTDLAFAIAKDYGCEVIEVLTGFKYIGEQIGRLEREGRADDFILGFEESYGYLTGTAVRDKDAVSSSLLICEMAAWYKAQGMTLCEALERLYARYGRYLHRLYSYEFPGADGYAHMQELMAALRGGRGAALFGGEVAAMKDYLSSDTSLPKSNVLSFRLKDGSGVIVRPSGTEPQIKIYVAQRPADTEKLQKLKEALDRYFV